MAAAQRSPRPSTLDARRSGPRAGRRFDADHGVDTEALVFLGDLDPEAMGPNLRHATHYQATPVADFGRLLAHVPFAISGATFIDVGAGMGRVVLLAAMRSFRQVVGVEISPALTAIARANIARVRRAALRCSDIRLTCRDAATYRFPAGDLVVYLFNPFDREVLGPIVTGLAARNGANLALIYHTPVERDVIDANAAFGVVGEERCGVVYSRVSRR